MSKEGPESKPRLEKMEDLSVKARSFITKKYELAKELSDAGYWTESGFVLNNAQGRMQLAVELGLMSIDEATEIHNKYFPLPYREFSMDTEESASE